MQRRCVPAATAAPKSGHDNGLTGSSTGGSDRAHPRELMCDFINNINGMINGMIKMIMV
jgi:hypothetical protein